MSETAPCSVTQTHNLRIIARAWRTWRRRLTKPDTLPDTLYAAGAFVAGFEAGFAAGRLERKPPEPSVVEIPS